MSYNISYDNACESGSCIFYCRVGLVSLVLFSWFWLSVMANKLHHY